MSTKPHRPRKPRQTAIQTPLLNFLRLCSPEQRDQVAKDCKTHTSYLYSIATCQRVKIGVQLAVAIADASQRMHAATSGHTPIVTVEEIANMCPVAMFKDGDEA